MFCNAPASASITDTTVPIKNPYIDHILQAKIPNHANTLLKAPCNPVPSSPPTPPPLRSPSHVRPFTMAQAKNLDAPPSSSILQRLPLRHI